MLLALWLIVRYARRPSLWSLTHLSFSYEFGFIKRGLVGEVLRWSLGDVRHEHLVLEVFALIVLCGVLAVFVRLCLLRDPALLVILSAPPFGFLLHEIGYLEQVCYACVVIVTLGMKDGLRAWPLVASASIFVHEAALFISVPIVVFLGFWQSGKSSATVWSILSTLLGVVVSVAAVLLLGQVDSAESRAIAGRLQAVVDFPIRADAVEVLSRSQANHWQIISSAWRAGLLLDRFVGSFWSAVIYSAAILYLLDRNHLRGLEQRTGWILFAIAVTMSPMCLLFFGWDVQRWNALCVVNAAVLYGVLSTKKGEASCCVPWTPTEMVCCVGLIGLGCLSDFPLFDGYVVRAVPFDKVWEDMFRAPR